MKTPKQAGRLKLALILDQYQYISLYLRNGAREIRAYYGAMNG